MKKITFLLSALTVSLTSIAQQSENYYNFTQSTSTYADLVSPTSINNGEVWQFDQFGPFNISFPVEVFGIEFNQFYFDDDTFYLGNVGNEDLMAVVDPITTYISDRGVITGTSISPLSYKVEGTTGNRIFKIEVKNAGLEDEEFFNGTTNIFLNYQIWMYESDKSIEYRYGDTNITEINKLEFMEDLWLPVLAMQNNAAGNVAYLDGNLTEVNYNEEAINEETDLESFGLNGIVPANTVYRFSRNPLSAKDMEKVSFSMFPNPVNSVLNLTFADPITKTYYIYDMAGRMVIKGDVNNNQSAEINVSTLREGSYILKIGNSTKKFIKN